MPPTVDIKLIAIGTATAYVADWGANATPGTFTEVGALKEASELQDTRELYEVELESTVAPVVAVENKRDVNLKLHLAHADLSLLHWILAQSAAATGTTPNFTRLVGAGIEKYHAFKIEGKGIAGATYVRALRTISVWRCAIGARDPMVFAKARETTFGFSVRVFQDPTVSTADQFYKMADTAGA